MPELYLLRHAKSSWEDPSLDDFDRPLSRRGRKAAPLMGREMARRGWLPQAALVSAALRTRQTWLLVAGALGEEAASPSYERALYMASAGDILARIRRVPGKVGRLVVLGHNPGLEDLASVLAGPDSDGHARAAMRAKFPTAALARFEVEDGWSALGPSAARLTEFLRPRDLAK